MRSFNDYLGGGYWAHIDGSYRAIIKKSGRHWYGGACTNEQRSVPLHGPYRLRRTAKKIALEYLSMIREEDE
jgi:hypothetical protein